MTLILSFYQNWLTAHVTTGDHDDYENDDDANDDDDDDDDDKVCCLPAWMGAWCYLVLVFIWCLSALSTLQWHT